MTGEGKPVQETCISAQERLHDGVSNDHGSKRGIGTRDALGAGDDVRHVVVLVGTEPLTKASKCADGVIRDH